MEEEDNLKLIALTFYCWTQF